MAAPDIHDEQWPSDDDCFMCEALAKARVWLRDQIKEAAING